MTSKIEFFLSIKSDCESTSSSICSGQSSASLFQDPFEGINQLIIAAKILEQNDKIIIKSQRSCLMDTEESNVTAVIEVAASSLPQTPPSTTSLIIESIKPQSIQNYFQCPLSSCRKVFKRKDNLKCHMRTHDPKRSRPFACSSCDRSYLRSIDLKRHIETLHEGIRDFQCDLCKKGFTRKEGLMAHLNRHKVKGEWKMDVDE
jgi:uncharacterized Zn-finger protein